LIFRVYTPIGSDLVKLPRRRREADEMALSVSEVICTIPPPSRLVRGSKFYELPIECFMKILETIEKLNEFSNNSI
jgi:hypothetical protein